MAFTYSKGYFLAVLALLTLSGCGNQPANGTTSDDKDSLMADTSVVADRDDYDWTPEEFMKEHYDEWLVVKPAINIQQREGETDYGT